MTKHLILTADDFKRFAGATQNTFKTPFRPFEIEIRPLKDTVSRQQQSFIFWAIYPRLKQQLLDCGYQIAGLTENQFDYFMRSMFYADIVITSKGEHKIPRRLCFDKAHKDEVSKYIDDLLHFGAQIGCYIPSRFF